MRFDRQPARNAFLGDDDYEVESEDVHGPVTVSWSYVRTPVYDHVVQDAAESLRLDATEALATDCFGQLASPTPASLELASTTTPTVLTLITVAVGQAISTSSDGTVVVDVDRSAEDRIVLDLHATVSGGEVALPPTTVAGSVDSTPFRLWERAESCTSDVCEAEVTGPVVASNDDVRVTVRGTDDAPGTGTLLLGWLGDREFPGAEDANRCGTEPYQGLPGTILFDVAGEVQGEKLVTVQVSRNIVQRDTNNGRAPYNVCLLGEGGLAAREGRDVEDDVPTDPFLLPNCGLNEDGTSNAPCIESRTAVRSVGSLPREWRSTLRGGLEIVIRLPAGDPMFR